MSIARIPLLGDHTIQLTLIQRVDLHRRRHLFQRVHHPAGHVGVQRVVGGEHRDVAATHLLFDFEIRRAHRYAQRLRLGAAGDHAAVVVGQHDHRLPAQIGPKDGLAGGVEAVNVHQSEQGYRAA